MHAVLQTCIAVEERVGAIYAELVNHPEADAELKAIWQGMADDEYRHAHRIRLVADRLEMAGLHDPGLDAARAQALLDRAGELLDDAIQGRLTLSEALYASVELEDEFMQAHLVYADAGGQPDLQTMFKFLAEADREHTQALKSYLDRLGDGAGLEFTDPEAQP